MYSQLVAIFFKKNKREFVGVGVEIKELKISLEAILSIQVICKETLSSRLFARFLSGAITSKVEVSLAETSPNSVGKSSIIILNAADFSEVELIGLTSDCYKKYKNCFLMIINASKNKPFFEIIEWPNVKALLHENVTDEAIISGIKALDMGYLWLPREYTDYLANTLRKAKSLYPKNVRLTKREKQILPLVALGKTNEEIAREFCISPHTIKTHLYKAYKKMGVKNRFEAFNWIKENGTYIG